MLKDSRVLVVGGLGFIGVNLVAKLKDSGARTTILTRDQASHAEQATEFERGGIEVIEGDIRDRNVVARAVVGQQIVFNLSLPVAWKEYP